MFPLLQRLSPILLTPNPASAYCHTWSKIEECVTQSKVTKVKGHHKVKIDQPTDGRIDKQADRQGQTDKRREIAQIHVHWSQLPSRLFHPVGKSSDCQHTFKYHSKNKCWRYRADKIYTDAIKVKWDNLSLISLFTYLCLLASEPQGCSPKLISLCRHALPLCCEFLYVHVLWISWCEYVSCRWSTESSSCWIPFFIQVCLLQKEIIKESVELNE